MHSQGVALLSKVLLILRCKLVLQGDRPANIVIKISIQLLVKYVWNINDRNELWCIHVEYLCFGELNMVFQFFGIPKTEICRFTVSKIFLVKKMKNWWNSACNVEGWPKHVVPRHFFLQRAFFLNFGMWLLFWNSECELLRGCSACYRLTRVSSAPARRQGSGAAVQSSSADARQHPIPVQTHSSPYFPQLTFLSAV